MEIINKEDYNVPVFSWCPDIEENAQKQIDNLARLPFAYKRIAVMGDCHSGYGMPIGGVLATKGAIIPNAVGVDIGCGVRAVKTTLMEISTETLKEVMGETRRVVPVGFNHHKTNQSWKGFDSAPEIDILQRELSSARKQLGTLGSGNHFCEIQKDDDGFIWVMIHSGSRNLGLKVANYYHKKAKDICEKYYSNIPNRDLSFLPIDSKEGREYFDAMKFCQEFASENRALMMRNTMNILESETGTSVVEEIDISHNYASMEHHYGENVLVHRKGATRAIIGEKGIIPGSMGTSSYIVEGLSNPQSFYSCSHGAGRKMGRKEATRTLNLEEEQSKMSGIIHGIRTVNELDEAPGAYKDIDTVMGNQKDLVKILVKLRPLAVIKG